MNARLRIAVLSLSALGLVACASTPDSASVKPSTYPHYRFVQDTEYISAYEQVAQRRAFVRVNWVNLPMRRVKVEN